MKHLLVLVLSSFILLGGIAVAQMPKGGMIGCDFGIKQKTGIAVSGEQTILTTGELIQTQIHPFNSKILETTRTIFESVRTAVINIINKIEEIITFIILTKG